MDIYEDGANFIAYITGTLCYLIIFNIKLEHSLFSMNRNLMFKVYVWAYTLLVS